MKKRVVSAVLLLAAAVLAPAQRISLAVTAVEPIGVRGDTAKIVEQIVQEEFAGVPLFQLVERDRLDQVLQEQELQVSGITSAESAVRAGGLLNVQKVVFGSIGKYQSEYVSYMLSLRLVDVERGAVEATGSVDIPSDKEIRASVAQLVERLAARISISGRVARVEEGAVYTTLGETLGVGPGDTLGVYRVSAVTDDAGAVVMREETAIANLEVEKSSEEGSLCRVLEKSGDVEAGMLVRKGRAAVEQDSAAAAVLVRSVPENARVFLDSQFIGVTPVRQSGLVPGSYRLEIRTEGYKAYAGRVTLVRGRTATVDRELEPESPAIEDILMLGKIPRRPTDPKEALRRALIPGAGFTYNGYPEMSAIVPLLLVAGGINATMLYGSGFAGDDYALPNAEAYNDAYVIAMIGAFLFPYVTSLVDAPRTAGEEFRYPAYSEVSSGGSLMYVRRRDLEEVGYPDPAEMAEAVSGISNAFWGMDLFYLHAGRSYFIDFGLQTHLTQSGSSVVPVFSFRLGMYYKLWRHEDLAVGFGVDTVTNIYLGSASADDVAYPTRQDVFPGLILSYLTPRWEFDLTATGVSYFMGSTYAQQVTTILAGPRARLDLRYFFGLRPGIRVAAEYQHMWNIDGSQRDSGLGAVNTYQMFNATLGIVYRF